MSLREYTTDELLSELVRREHNEDGGVLHWLVRASLYGEGVPDPIILNHRNVVQIEHTTAQVLIEVLIDGDWRSHEWLPPRPTGHEKCKPPPSSVCFNPADYHNCPVKPGRGIHRSQYD